MQNEIAGDYRGSGVARVRAKDRRGRRIELGDRSHWEVSPGHEIFTEHWPTETAITVVPGDFAGYPYDLINVDSGDRVPARYLGHVKSLGWRLLED